MRVIGGEGVLVVKTASRWKMNRRDFGSRIGGGKVATTEVVMVVLLGRSG